MVRVEMQDMDVSERGGDIGCSWGGDAGGDMDESRTVMHGCPMIRLD